MVRAILGSRVASPPNHLKSKAIQVSPAVLDSARKDGNALLTDLGTALVGLTQSQAEVRACTAGPNEIAQEKPQGWLACLLKIIRNPLVVLLATLSAVSFGTGNARAGTVMASMVVLSGSENLSRRMTSIPKCKPAIGSKLNLDI